MIEKAAILDAIRQASISFGLNRFEVETTQRDLLAWLAQQQDAVRLYWEDDKCTERVAGLGTAHDYRVELGDTWLDQMKLIEKQVRLYPTMRYFGGISFSNAYDCQSPSDQLWEQFGGLRFVLPRFELGIKNERYYFAYNVLCQANETCENVIDTFSQLIDQLNWEVKSPSSLSMSVVGRQDCPEQSKWEEVLAQVQQDFDQNRYEKVVLARRSTFELSETVDPFLLLRGLKKSHSHTFNFGFQFEKGLAFVGTSPEYLFQTKERQIRSVAVAGTTLQTQQSALLENEKNRKEQRYVYDMIAAVLAQFCQNLNHTHDPFILRYYNVSHLCHLLEGNLKEDVSVSDVLMALHPTPAVGGVEKESALAAIQAYEPFQRGWYSGLVGVVGHESSCFAVAIRSLLVNKNYCHAFSGAGILKESRSDLEWDELELKIQNVKDYFHI